MSILNRWNSLDRLHALHSGVALAAILMGACLAGWSPDSWAVNYIALHDSSSSQYNGNCLSCHANVMTDKPLVISAPVINPLLNQTPRTLAVHGTTLKYKPGYGNNQCIFCHRSVNVVEGPPMPQDPIKGSIRKHVDPTLCTLCHGPKVGGQPNSPGPQLYRVGLNSLVTDGAQLYGLVCSGCHKPLPNSEVLGKSASEITSEIRENEGGMGPLKVLTSIQVQAIANALH